MPERKPKCNEFRKVRKFCLHCGKELKLDNTRDIIRKKYCSKSCLGCCAAKKQPGEYLPKRKPSSEQIRKAKLKHKYNLTLEDYNKLWEQQNGLCTICGNPETAKHQSGTTLNLAVDHNHETGKVRGLLCRSCNFMIAHSKDDINVLKNAIKYLKEN